MEARPKLITVGLPPPVVTQPVLSHPYRYTSVQEPSLEDPPAAVDTYFDKLHSELYPSFNRSFEDESESLPSSQKKPTRRHTDEKVNASRERMSSDETDTSRRAGDRARPSVLTFEERKKKSSDPRNAATQHGHRRRYGLNTDTRILELAIRPDGSRMPAHELFPPIEIKRRPVRKPEANAEKPSVEVADRMATLSLADKAGNDNNAAAQAEKNNDSAGRLRLEKRSYDESETEAEEQLSAPSMPEQPTKPEPEQMTIELFDGAPLKPVVPAEFTELPVEDPSTTFDAHEVQVKQNNVFLLATLLSLLLLMIVDILGGAHMNNL